jgi:mannobiose 2-epimerase
MTIPELNESAKKELTENILPFWEKYGRDRATGGFYGFLGNDNKGDASSPRSVVMTSRHLWAYSAAARSLSDPSWLSMADYAYGALMRDFVDQIHGGAYWSVKADGTPEVAKKQIYGEAFAMYALSEYAAALFDFRPNAAESSDTMDSVLDRALSIYDLVETHARDRKFGGYAEARARDWSPTADLKLSGKDIDCDKSMNTNLHVMEALTTLLRSLRLVRPSDTKTIARVGESLASLIEITIARILGKDGHLDLYFADDWSPMGDIVSYGHDIEASWLLWEAMEELVTIYDSAEKTDSRIDSLSERLRPIVISMAEVALAEGTDAATGALENEFHGGRKDRTRVWWCQAEALVGFFNAWQLSRDAKFLDAVMRQWAWICEYQRDGANGDWFASVDPEGKPILAEPKGGNWKTSYHNGRCCMELLRRTRHDELV